MKILIGNNTLSLLAGSETWVLTLARELKRQGHEVFCFSPSLGIIAEKLESEGIHCYNDLLKKEIKPFSFIFQEEIKHDYDIIIANHNHIVFYLREVFPNKPIISTIHGIIHFDGNGNIAPEHPALNSGVAQFVAVSEEVQDKLKNEYQIDSIIIRNFFDLNNLKSIRPISSGKPKQFLINTNYQSKDDPEITVLREVANHYGAKLSAIGMNFNQTLDTKRVIEDADVVFGMGRSVLEGVAMGRLGIVQGRWGTGGVICKDNISSLKFYNFSGRNSGGKLATKEELIAMIDKYYNQETIDWGLNYIRSEHDVFSGADRYVDLAMELTGQKINKKYDIEEFQRDLTDSSMPHTKDKKRFKDFYNELGKDPIQDGQTYEAIERRMRFIEPKGKILELGCHCGFDLIHWARQGFECVGVDCSDSLIEMGKKKVSRESPEIQNRITFVNSFIEDFIPKEKYETIVLTETLEHVIDPVSILKKAEECLSEDGRIFVSVPEVRCGNFSHVRGINKKELAIFLSETGLIVEYWIEGLFYYDDTDVQIKIPITTAIVMKKPC